jgi:RNA polymerase sigma factor (sigma-70 family)
MNERQKIATDNIKLVYHFANQFKGYCEKEGVTIEDLISIGTIGLMKAIDNHDPSKGLFGSFASPYIKGELQHYFRDGKFSLIRHKRGESAQCIFSLDVTLKDDVSTTRLECLADDLAEELDDNTHFIEQYRYCLALLPWYEADCLQMHVNGLNNKEIADWLELYPMKITRILSNAKILIKNILEQDKNRKVSKCKRIRNALPFKKDGFLEVPQFKSNCAICGKIFGLWKIPTRKPSCCNGTCSKALANQKVLVGGKIWSKAEFDLLDTLVGTMPYRKLIEQFRLRYPERSFNAIKIKLTRRYKSTKSVKDNWNMRELARMLDIPVDRIRVWRRVGLKVEQVNRNLAISREAINEFCYNEYARFYGIISTNLSKVIDDPKLVDLCTEMPKIVKRVEYQRLDNKKIYSSLREASRELGMARSSIIALTQRDDGWIKKSTVLV